MIAGSNSKKVETRNQMITATPLCELTRFDGYSIKFCCKGSEKKLKERECFQGAPMTSSQSIFEVEIGVSGHGDFSGGRHGQHLDFSRVSEMILFRRRESRRDQRTSQRQIAVPVKGMNEQTNL